jgi:hypothetical protein
LLKNGAFRLQFQFSAVAENNIILIRSFLRSGSCYSKFTPPDSDTFVGPNLPYHFSLTMGNETQAQHKYSYELQIPRLCNKILNIDWLICVNQVFHETKK